MLRRPRRNRKSQAVRSAIAETYIGEQHMIMPLFLVLGSGIKDQITSLPMAYRWSLDTMMDEIGECLFLGIDKFIIFPAIPEDLKDKTATYSYDPDNFYLQAATKIKEKYPTVCLISDVAMDPSGCPLGPILIFPSPGPNNQLWMRETYPGYCQDHSHLKVNYIRRTVKCGRPQVLSQG